MAQTFHNKDATAALGAHLARREGEALDYLNWVSILELHHLLFILRGDLVSTTLRV
jgi:hypothetical protein